MKTDYTRKILEEHRNIWNQKPVLREIYLYYFTRIRNACKEGITVEVGGGSGNFKEVFPDLLSLDIVRVPWIDIVADAQKLPFKDGSLANIVMVDVIHHFEAPLLFLEEVERVLQPGGRLIFIEPAITPLSWVMLHLFHPEPIDMRVDPFKTPTSDPDRRPFEANQAIPTLLFKKYRARFIQEFPLFKIRETSFLDLFAYPLTGGFRPWCLLSCKSLRHLFDIEQRILPILGPLMAFRLYCILEKNR